MQHIKNVSYFADVLLIVIETVSSRYINSLPALNVPVLYEDFENGVLTGIYQINPSTDVVAIAAAKNIDGVWGEINVLRFTTPDECEGYVLKGA